MSMNPVSLSLHHRHHHHHHHHRHHRREQMFEKTLTPSDVGKLNRLVIPKQHAERYFPLAGGAGGGQLAKVKELALGFEDEAGRPWRFRYSYWTSSQSYVLTKGWSRFVKEKKLRPGDAVVFERLQLLDARAGECYRHFIGCRHTAASNEKKSPGADILPPPDDERENNNGAAAPVPASSKRLRLFGVNLECGPDSGRRLSGLEFSGHGEYVSN